MKKLLILSGKGGTGKTTTTAAFISFSKARAFADCDVDAPNLHLVASAKGPMNTEDFYGGDKAEINAEMCSGCSTCMEYCRFEAISINNGIARVSEQACEGCGVCEYICPQNAIKLKPDIAGRLMLQSGEIVFSTAELRMGRGNSGKLVTAVKKNLFQSSDSEFAIIDGSPGIGCPVIASISGMDLVLIVAEPSLSGISDLKRIVTTAKTLESPVAICVNKYDTSLENTEKIENFCTFEKIPFVGKIPYDKTVSSAINRGISVAEFECPARDALFVVYQNVMKILRLSV